MFSQKKIKHSQEISAIFKQKHSIPPFSTGNSYQHKQKSETWAKMQPYFVYKRLSGWTRYDKYVHITQPKHQSLFRHWLISILVAKKDTASGIWQTTANIIILPRTTNWKQLFNAEDTTRTEI